MKNHRFWLHDFEVYHKAASRIITGENLYRGDIDGFYKYKYSPACAMFFTPLGILPFSIAKAIYWVFLSGIICLGFYLSLRIVLPSVAVETPSRINNFILLLAFITAVHFERELHLGQVNQLLLVLYLALVFLWQNSRIKLSSLLWAGSIFIKPFGLIFLPYFIIKRQYRLIGWLILWLVILGLSPVFFYGWPGLLGQYGGWIAELTNELANKQDLMQAGNHTIFSIFARFTPLRILEFTSTVTFFYQTFILLLLAILFILLLRKGRGIENQSAPETAFLIGLIPLLAFTSHNAFGFLELAIVVVLVNWRELPSWGKTIGICGFAFSGGNIHDIVGKTLWNFLSDISLVAWGALLILAVLVILRMRRLA